MTTQPGGVILGVVDIYCEGSRDPTRDLPLSTLKKTKDIRFEKRKRLAMKICRYGNQGQEKPGVLDANNILRDLSGSVSDITPETLPIVLDLLKKEDDIARLPEVKGNPRLGSPLNTVSKFVAIGLNYLDHAKEANLAAPDEPVIFF
ncbi:hypothetical protein DZS_21530 [Dickeya ananatis]